MTDIWKNNLYAAERTYPERHGVPLRRTADYWMALDLYWGLRDIDGRRWSPETVAALREAREAVERLRAAMIHDERFQA